MTQLPRILKEIKIVDEEITVSWNEDYDCVIFDTTMGELSAYPIFQEGQGMCGRTAWKGWQLDVETVSPGDRWNPPEADAETLADGLKSPCDLLVAVFAALSEVAIRHAYEAIPAKELGMIDQSDEGGEF